MGNGLSEEAVASPEQYSLAQALRHRGQPTPLGATLSPEGANFSVFSASATGFIISVFDHVDALTPRKSIRLGPKINRMGHYWHIFIPELKAEQIYVYRAEGPNDPPNGQRFDASKILIDPYGKAVAVGKHYSRAVYEGEHELRILLKALRALHEQHAVGAERLPVAALP